MKFELQTERKERLHCHIVLKNLKRIIDKSHPTDQVWLENLWCHFDVPVYKMLKQVNHPSGSYRYLAHTTNKRAMMEKKDRYEVQELLLRYETDVLQGNLSGEDLELCYHVTKSKEMFCRK